MDSIELRLQRLERANRRWRTACVGLFALFGLAFCVGANDPTDEIRDVIKARRFEALNENGELVGLFTGSERGGVLVVHGAGKRGASVLLDATARAGEISTTDNEGRPLVELGFNVWGDVDPLPDPLPEPLHTGGTLWLNVGDETVKSELGKKPRRIAVRLEAYKKGGTLKLMNSLEKAKVEGPCVVKLGATSENCGEVTVAGSDGRPQKGLKGSPGK